MIIRIEIGLFSQKNIDSLIKESVFALLNWKELIENPTPKTLQVQLNRLYWVHSVYFYLIADMLQEQRYDCQ